MSATQMEREALSTPKILADQLTENIAYIEEICTRLRNNPPHFVMTVARGSSDHAATFAKYLFETRAGLVTASAAPSVCTIYNSELHLKNALVIAISQSGESADVTEVLSYAKRMGAVTVAFVNEIDSPIAETAEYVIPLGAGKEVAVAATKTYLATLGALIQLLACYIQDRALMETLMRLPTELALASELDWSEAVEIYLKQESTLVVARGYGFPIAQEAALKFKETAKIHAEAFSSAELLHGPVALVQENFPILLFGQHDATLSGILEVGVRVKTLGGNVILALPYQQDIMDSARHAANLILPLPETLHPVCDPLMVIQAFYMMIARLSVARGFDPDSPRNITKVTQTW